MYHKILKRALDVFLSVLAIITLFPVIAIIALLIRLKLGGPVIFRQHRPGKNEKIFVMYKFRTMNNGKDESGKLLPDSIRLTKFGKILRSTSLDELPELFNIIKGDMSIIGPRPLLVEYLPRYTSEQKRRHNVRPGLSGWAQVNGRNAISWEEKFKLDIEYTQNISFLWDVKIIMKTIINVFKREGIHSGSSATMEPFLGVQKTCKERQAGDVQHNSLSLS